VMALMWWMPFRGLISPDSYPWLRIFCSIS